MISTCKSRLSPAGKALEAAIVRNLDVSLALTQGERGRLNTTTDAVLEFTVDQDDGGRGLVFGDKRC